MLGKSIGDWGIYIIFDCTYLSRSKMNKTYVLDFLLILFYFINNFNY